MRAQVLTAFGGPENFKLTDIPKPEVAVRVGRESSLSGSSRGQRFAAQRSGGPARHGRRPALLDGAGRPAKPESSAACELATRVPTSFRVVPAACLPLRTINMTLPLVTTDWLEERLGDPGLRVLEISNVNEPAAYCDGHVPGAVWLFWKDACWHESDRRFVTPEAMARLFGRLGITVVLYGEPVQYGTYVLGVHHGRAPRPAAARRWPPQMDPGEAAAVANRARLRAGRVPAAGPERVNAGRPRRGEGSSLAPASAVAPDLLGDGPASVFDAAAGGDREAMWHPGGCATASRACTCTDEGKIGATKAIDAKTSCSATLFGAAAVPDAACRCHCRVNPCTSGSELISHFGGGTTKGVPCSVF